MIPWPTAVTTQPDERLTLRVMAMRAAEREVPVSKSIVPTESEWLVFHRFNERNARDVKVLAQAVLLLTGDE
jgi:hypothetical protein